MNVFDCGLWSNVRNVTAVAPHMQTRISVFFACIVEIFFELICNTCKHVFFDILTYTCCLKPFHTFFVWNFYIHVFFEMLTHSFKLQVTTQHVCLHTHINTHARKLYDCNCHEQHKQLQRDPLTGEHQASNSHQHLMEAVPVRTL